MYPFGVCICLYWSENCPVILNSQSSRIYSILKVVSIYKLTKASYSVCAVCDHVTLQFSSITSSHVPLVC